MQMLIALAILAAVLAVAAVATFVTAGHIDANGPMHAKGKTIRMDDGDKRAKLIARLRWIAIGCLVLLAADGVAAYTFVNYNS